MYEVSTGGNAFIARPFLMNILPCAATCRLPFCICMLSNRYRKYKSIELGDQLRLAGLHIWSSIPGGNLLVALLSFSL